MSTTPSRLHSAGMTLQQIALLLFVGLGPLVFSSSVGAPFFTPKAALIFPAGVLFVMGVSLMRWSETPNLDLLDAAVLGFAVVEAASTLANHTPVVSFFGLYGQGTGSGTFILAALLLIVARRAQAEERRLALVALCVGGTVLAGLMWIQQLKLGWAVAHMGAPLSSRPGAAMGNPSFSGAFEAAALIATFGLAVITQKRYLPAIAVAAAATGSGAMLAFSRGAWVAVGAGAVAAILLLPQLRTLWRRQLILVTVVAVAVGLTLLASAAPLRQEAGFSVTERLTSSDPLSRESAASRVALTKIALRALIAKPVLGWGPGEFQLPWQRYVENATLSGQPDSWGTDAHGLFQEVAATTGALGLLAILATAVLIVVRTWSHRGRGSEETAVAFTVGTTLFVALSLNPQHIVLTPLLFLFAGFAVPADGPAPARAGRFRSLIWPGTAVLAGVALVASLLLAALALQADGLVLEASVRRDSALHARGAERFPFYPLLYFDAGTAAAASGSPQDVAGALALYDKGLQLQPADAYGLQTKAAVLLSASRPEEAIAAADAALNAFPLDPRAKLAKARALIALGRPEEARRVCADILTLERLSASEYLLVAKTLMLAKDPNAAKETVATGLSHYPGDGPLGALAQQIGATTPSK